MKNTIFFAGAACLLTACNSISVKPETMITNQTVYADRGGFGMKRSIKNELERRGYKVLVGKAVSAREIDIDSPRIPGNARYYVHVSERDEKFRPVWCAFNGVWWWNFSISVADQKTGEELMTWRGRGCADSSMRLLRKTLDKLERENGKR